MNDTFTLGRIAGIRIGVHWSWALIFLLISWTLAVSVFPAQNPDLSNAAYAAMALVAALLFFVSLLLHELGHALQARRERVEIEGITLWLFGGVAKFRGDLPSAGAELRIAVAGPAVTLGIAVLCIGLAAAVGEPEAVDGVLAWLGYTNVALLLFNMLPGLPLDGGRVLRALLWLRSGDLARATYGASAVARVLAYGLIGLGIAGFFFLGAFGGAWLAFIGWFLLQAAGAEARWVATRQALGGLHVDDVMTRDPISVSPSLPLEQFVDDVLWRERHSTYPVVEGGRPVGLLPFRRVADTPRGSWPSTTVRDRMVPLDEVVVLTEDERLPEALASLQEDGTGRALVLEDGRLVGILSPSDVARVLEVQRLRRRARNPVG